MVVIEALLVLFLSVAGFAAPTGSDAIQVGTTDCARALSILLTQGAVNRIDSTEAIGNGVVLYTLVGDRHKLKAPAPVAHLMCNAGAQEPPVTREPPEMQQ